MKKFISLIFITMILSSSSTFACWRRNKSKRPVTKERVKEGIVQGAKGAAEVTKTAGETVKESVEAVIKVFKKDKNNESS